MNDNEKSSKIIILLSGIAIGISLVNLLYGLIG